MSEAVAPKIWTEAAVHLPPRAFASDGEVREVGEGLLARTLPRARWTHEAHLAAILWLWRERPEIDPPRDLPVLIRAYNQSVGGVNDDRQGYHETITQAYVRAVRGWLAANDAGQSLAALVNTLLSAPLGRRDWALTHWSRARLMSVAARHGWVEPDRHPLPALA